MVDVFAVDVVVHGLMDGRNQVSWVVIIHHNAIRWVKIVKVFAFRS